MSTTRIGAICDIAPVATSHGIGEKRVLHADHVVKQIAHTTLPPGATIEAHVHADMEEFFYIISGELAYTLNYSESGKLVSGSYLLVPFGIPHAFANNSSNAVEMLTIAIVK